MNDAVEVSTTAGTVRGRVRDGIGEFLGIPYAEPITASRRFRAPQARTPWSGVREATALSEVCPQVPTYGPVGTRAASTLTGGEDFLTVNVRTPDVGGRAPVLFWIHGGGYAVGSANEGALQTGAFAASGIVEVTANHRLGALGFLHLPDAPDNRGLLDLIAALEWVRDNIAAFGGDPDRVTLAGRSAGGFAVATLMAMPAARGLFHAALPQSGASVAVLRPADAARVSGRFFSSSPDISDISAVLRAQKAVCDESYTAHDADRDGDVAMLGVAFQPVIDGVSLPVHPIRADLAPVPMMIGCTTAEYRTHATVHPVDLGFTDAASLLHERVVPLGLTGAEIVARYRAGLPEHTGLGIWRAVGGDLVFQNPATRFADHAAASGLPVFRYLYGPIEPDELGAEHGAELGSVWYRGPGHLATVPPRQRPADPAAARVVHEIWASFIRDHVPPAPFSAHRPGAARTTRISGTEVFPAADPFAARLSWW
ncbi:carboxylesterase family protein [Actinoplanes sp. NBRC 101535]|uniref:carboxylesterase/lipase family protein n=1 Tax=Actinoplanes sp. NBRC 101535 TaxID=3032196 RepID=UPI00249FCB36|nr:carboxylesterase family protein [Actinoplanes sp. NBRC 101535]GLY03798.1 carboxylic ester hydrolase [Actinoplanes sp. NBRC 101535]